VDPKRIGAIGWCMGGGYSALLAVNEPTLKAAVINYGRLPANPDDVKKIKAKVLGNFGGKDDGIPADAIHEFEKQLKSAGNPADLKIYPEAHHGFMHGRTPEDAAAAKEAGPRIEAFLAQQLR